MAKTKEVSFDLAVSLNNDGKAYFPENCTDCNPQAQYPGYIAFPSLGTPLIVDPCKNTARIYVLLGEDIKAKLDIETVNGIEVCKNGHILTSQHL
ncbi:MAG: hypothetical protein LBG61_01530, partial [Burkholderiales bacterium]|nr:hypothetical protein [Burkholderiales bacterium]